MFSILCFSAFPPKVVGLEVGAPPLPQLHRRKSVNSEGASRLVTTPGIDPKCVCPGVWAPSLWLLSWNSHKPSVKPDQSLLNEFVLRHTRIFTKESIVKCPAQCRHSMIFLLSEWMNSWIIILFKLRFFFFLTKWACICVCSTYVTKNYVTYPRM